MKIDLQISDVVWERVLDKFPRPTSGAPEEMQQWREQVKAATRSLRATLGAAPKAAARKAAKQREAYEAQVAQLLAQAAQDAPRVPDIIQPVIDWELPPSQVFARLMGISTLPEYALFNKKRVALSGFDLLPSLEESESFVSVAMELNRLMVAPRPGERKRPAKDGRTFVRTSNDPDTGKAFRLVRLVSYLAWGNPFCWLPPSLELKEHMSLWLGTNANLIEEHNVMAFKHHIDANLAKRAAFTEMVERKSKPGYAQRRAAYRERVAKWRAAKKAKLSPSIADQLRDIIIQETTMNLLAPATLSVKTTTTSIPNPHVPLLALFSQASRAMVAYNVAYWPERCVPDTYGNNEQFALEKTVRREREEMADRNHRRLPSDKVLAAMTSVVNTKVVTTNGDVDVAFMTSQKKLMTTMAGHRARISMLTGLLTAAELTEDSLIDVRCKLVAETHMAAYVYDYFVQRTYGKVMPFWGMAYFLKNDWREAPVWQKDYAVVL